MTFNPHPEDFIVWPDGTYCCRSELWEMQHMSDDYRVIFYEDEDAWYAFAYANP